MYFPTKLTKTGIGVGGGNQLQPSADGLGNTRAAGLLGLVQEVVRNLHRDLSDGLHNLKNIP